MPADCWGCRDRYELLPSEREPQRVPGARPVFQIPFQSPTDLASHGWQQLGTHPRPCLIPCGDPSTVILDGQKALAFLDVEGNLDDAAVVFPEGMLDRVGHQLVDDQTEDHRLVEVEPHRLDAALHLNRP